MEDSSVIEKLLHSTGWSCEDLLSKLQQYNSVQPKQTAVDDENKEKEEPSAIKSNEDYVRPETQNYKWVQLKQTTVEDENKEKEEPSAIKRNEDYVLPETQNSTAGSNESVSSKDTHVQIDTCSNNKSDSSFVSNINNANKKTEEINKDNEEKEMISEEKSEIEEAVKDVQICPNIEDHNYSNSTNDVDCEKETLVSGGEDLSKSEDNLRNILRMQLSSLRNMKKSNAYMSDIHKKKSVFFHNLKKKRKSCDVQPVTPFVDESERFETTDKNENEVHSDHKEVSTDENSLVSLADETQFVIMDVTGGVDRLSGKDEKNTNLEENVERRFASVNIGNMDISTPQYSTYEKIAIPIEKNKHDASSRKDLKNILSNYRRKMSLNYFDANRYAPKSIPVEGLQPISVCKNISENFHQDPGVNKSIKNSEKSPFVSDSLDDFLNESSQLKISYSIPKSGAEEGIIDSTKKSIFDDNITSRNAKIENSTNQYRSRKQQAKLPKAKTLAEMRRNFEKMKSKSIEHNKLHGTKIKTAPSQNSTAISSNLKAPLNLASHRNSFVMYNKKKIWVSSNFKNKCVALIDNPLKKVKGAHEKRLLSPSAVEREPSVNRKPSLLASLQESKVYKVKYKPGPLCKKPQLQSTDSINVWTTVLKKLPKVNLEVIPELNKPIEPKIAHLLPIFDDVIITEERANFALSVLKSNNVIEDPILFKFDIPYNNNQEKIAVRKRFKPSLMLDEGHEILKEKDAETVISSILSDIIRYVEVKEIEDSLIKEDEIVVEEQNNVLNVKTKTRKKTKKLDLELRRLNCKVIDMATNVTEEKECRKPYCKLGCVCKSLLCQSVFSNHCQLVACMFGCTCAPPSADVKDSLSPTTVNHLEDKAKKYLAKVEREFTQTLIHTDNDTILVGTGGRSKMKRTSKVPKKYSDFIGDMDEILQTTPPSATPSPPPPVATEKPEAKACSISLTRLNFGSIIPYCLYHQMYNCHCKGEMIDAASVSPKNNVIPKIRIVKSKEDQHKSWYNSCARIRKVFPEYKVRNSDPKYNECLRIKNLNLDLNKCFSEKLTKDTCETETATPSCNVGPTPTVKTKQIKKSTKRKQIFDIREDVQITIPPTNQEDISLKSILRDNNEQISKSSVEENKEFALQRRKKKNKSDVHANNRKSPEVSSLQKSPEKCYIPIFDGEIRVSLQDNQEMFKIIGEENASLEYLRILPWSKVIESFRTGKISIWSRETRSSTLLCNAAGYFPPKHFVDIRNICNKSDIIKWILTDTLPPDRPRDIMHLMLTPRKNHFLICGFCLKQDNGNQTNTSTGGLEHLQNAEVNRNVCAPTSGENSEHSKSSDVPDVSNKESHRSPERIQTVDDYVEQNIYCNEVLTPTLTEELASDKANLKSDPIDLNENSDLVLSPERIQTVVDYDEQNIYCNEVLTATVTEELASDKANLKSDPIDLDENSDLLLSTPKFIRLVAGSRIKRLKVSAVAQSQSRAGSRTFENEDVSPIQVLGNKQTSEALRSQEHLEIKDLDPPKSASALAYRLVQKSPEGKTKTKENNVFSHFGQIRCRTDLQDIKMPHVPFVEVTESRDALLQTHVEFEKVTSAESSKLSSSECQPVTACEPLVLEPRCSISETAELDAKDSESQLLLNPELPPTKGKLKRIKIISSLKKLLPAGRPVGLYPSFKKLRPDGRPVGWHPKIIVRQIQMSGSKSDSNDELYPKEYRKMRSILNMPSKTQVKGILLTNSFPQSTPHIRSSAHKSNNEFVANFEDPQISIQCQPADSLQGVESVSSFRPSMESSNTELGANQTIGRIRCRTDLAENRLSSKESSIILELPQEEKESCSSNIRDLKQMSLCDALNANINQYQAAISNSKFSQTQKQERNVEGTSSVETVTNENPTSKIAKRSPIIVIRPMQLISGSQTDSNIRQLESKISCVESSRLKLTSALQSTDGTPNSEPFGTSHIPSVEKLSEPEIRVAGKQSVSDANETESKLDSKDKRLVPSAKQGKSETVVDLDGEIKCDQVSQFVASENEKQANKSQNVELSGSKSNGSSIQAASCLQEKKTKEDYKQVLLRCVPVRWQPRRRRIIKQVLVSADYNFNTKLDNKEKEQNPLPVPKSIELSPTSMQLDQPNLNNEEQLDVLSQEPFHSEEKNVEQIQTILSTNQSENCDNGFSSRTQRSSTSNEAIIISESTPNGEELVSIDGSKLLEDECSEKDTAPILREKFDQSNATNNNQIKADVQETTPVSKIIEPKLSDKLNSSVETAENNDQLHMVTRELSESEETSTQIAQDELTKPEESESNSENTLNVETQAASVSPFEKNNVDKIEPNVISEPSNALTRHTVPTIDQIHSNSRSVRHKSQPSLNSTGSRELYQNTGKVQNHVTSESASVQSRPKRNPKKKKLFGDFEPTQKKAKPNKHALLSSRQVEANSTPIQSIGATVKQSEIPLNSEENMSKTLLSEADPTNPTTHKVLKCTHKDMYNKNKTMVLTNRGCTKRKLYFNQAGAGPDVLVALPKVAKKSRWRMIYLNSDFTFLSFVKANYSIKYTDLMDVVKLSNSIKATITLTNREFSEHYGHPLFGIVCTPDFQDRLFIGPFLNSEQHNIETLRYLRGKLIDTQIFNKMVGKNGDKKSPVWIYETPAKRQVLPSDLVIDITQDDDEVINLDLVDDSSSDDEIMTNNLLCPPFVEQITAEELRTRKINRYIMTNIPHLGYFSAYQSGSATLDVFWANDTKGYRFPDVTFAKSCLIRYLSDIFRPVPQDFQINVIVMTDLDLNSNKPVDPKYFCQICPRICGEFGIYEKDTVPDDLLKKYEAPSFESLLKRGRCEEESEAQMIRLFGLFLMSNEEYRKHSEPDSILQWAKSEVYIQDKLAENYKAELSDLKNIRRRSASKVKQLRKKQAFDWAGVTNNAGTPIKGIEVIEIKDSDEEDNQAANAEVTGKTVVKKISTCVEDTPNASEGRSLLKPQFQRQRSLPNYN